MAQIIGLEDFKQGKYSISTNMYTTIDLNTYINQNESKYLQELLGVELYDLLIQDLVDGIPQTERFEKIFMPFAFNDDKGVVGHIWFTENQLVRSEGMTEMLKGFIYSEYVKEQNFKNTISGNSQDDIEVAKLVSAMSNGLQEKYNNAVTTYDAIQTYICRNKPLYPEFKGIAKQYLGIV